MHMIRRHPALPEIAHDTPAGFVISDLADQLHALAQTRQNHRLVEGISAEGHPDAIQVSGIPGEYFLIKWRGQDIDYSRANYSHIIHLLSPHCFPAVCEGNFAAAQSTLYSGTKLSIYPYCTKQFTLVIIPCFVIGIKRTGKKSYASMMHDQYVKKTASPASSAGEAAYFFKQQALLFYL
jgi:hypothetical protein